MIIEVRQTAISGCFEIFPRVIKDERGFFIKTFHIEIFKEFGLETDFREEFYSCSKKGVLRGLHFQLPPMDHVKLVYCVYGEVLDVVVDLRIGSPKYGQFQCFNLSASQFNMLYIPRGLAHGFYVLSDSAIMIYKLTTVHSPIHDTGILWNSLNIPWPDANPIISKRDNGFVSFKDFQSPFIYEK